MVGFACRRVLSGMFCRMSSAESNVGAFDLRGVNGPLSSYLRMGSAVVKVIFISFRRLICRLRHGHVDR